MFKRAFNILSHVIYIICPLKLKMDYELNQALQYYKVDIFILTSTYPFSRWNNKRFK